jgi:hypothetical protein
MTYAKQLVFLILLLAFGLYFMQLINNTTEYFSNLKMPLDPGNFPHNIDKVILNDFNQIGKNETSNKNYSQIWWQYPIFTLGSYEQITNNLQYRYNPDNGSCIRADFCDALYYNSKNTKTNIITPLPPAEEGDGARVGYYRSEPNELYFSIPTNENILY